MPSPRGRLREQPTKAGGFRHTPWVVGIAVLALAVVGWILTRPATMPQAPPEEPSREALVDPEVGDSPLLAGATVPVRTPQESPIAGRVLLAVTGRPIPSLNGVLRLRVHHAGLGGATSELLELPITEGAWIGPVLPESFQAYVTGVELGDVSVTHVTPSLFTAADLPVDLVVKLAEYVELVVLDANTRAPLRDVSVWVRPTGGSVHLLLSNTDRWHRFRRAPPSKQWDDLVAALVPSPVRVESIRASDRWIVGAPGYAPTLVEPVATPTERYQVLLQRSGILRLVTDSLDGAVSLKLFYPGSAPAEPGDLPNGALLADLFVEPRAGDKDIDLVPGAYAAAWRSDGEKSWTYARVELHAGEVEELRFTTVEDPVELADLTLEFVFQKPVVRAPRIRIVGQGRALELDTTQSQGPNLEEVWSTAQDQVPVGPYSATLLGLGYSYPIDVLPGTNHLRFELAAEEARRIWILDAHTQKPVEKVRFFHGTFPLGHAGPNTDVLRATLGRMAKAAGGPIELSTVAGSLFYTAMPEGYGVLRGELEIVDGVHEYQITAEASSVIELRVTFRGQPIDAPSDWLTRVAVFDLEGNPIPILSHSGESRGFSGSASTTSDGRQVVNVQAGASTPSDSVRLLGVGAATGTAIVRLPALDGIAPGAEVTVELVAGERAHATLALQ